MRRQQAIAILLLVSLCLGVVSALGFPVSAAQYRDTGGGFPVIGGPSIGGGSGESDPLPGETTPYVVRLGPETIEEGEVRSFETVASKFAGSPFLPEGMYPGELDVFLDGPVVVEAGASLAIGTLSLGGEGEASPVLHGTLSREPLILVRAGGRLVLKDVELDLQGEGVLILQEPGASVEVQGMTLPDELIQWDVPFVENSQSPLSDVWLEQGEKLTQEDLPAFLETYVQGGGKEEWQKVSIAWDLSGYDGRTSGEWTITGRFVDADGTPLLSALPPSVTIHWYRADELIVLDTDWTGKEAAAARITLGTLPAELVRLWGEVSEDEGATWEVWEASDFWLLETTDGTQVAVFAVEDDTPRLFRVRGSNEANDRFWTTDSFLLPDQETEDQGGNRGGAMTPVPPEREPIPLEADSETEESFEPGAADPQGDETMPEQDAAGEESTEPQAKPEAPKAPEPQDDLQLTETGEASPQADAQPAGQTAHSAETGRELTVEKTSELHTPDIPENETTAALPEEEMEAAEIYGEGQTGKEAGVPQETEASSAKQTNSRSIQQILLVLGGLAVCARAAVLVRKRSSHRA